MGYFKHLKYNLLVFIHCMGDAFAHLIHGFIPVIRVKHHQPSKVATLLEK